MDRYPRAFGAHGRGSDSCHAARVGPGSRYGFQTKNKIQPGQTPQDSETMSGDQVKP